MLKIGGIYNLGEYYIVIIDKDFKLQLVYYYILFFNISNNKELNKEIKKIDNYNLHTSYAYYDEKKMEENTDGYLGQLEIRNLTYLKSELKKSEICIFLKSKGVQL